MTEKSKLAEEEAVSSGEIADEFIEEKAPEELGPEEIKTKKDEDDVRRNHTTLVSAHQALLKENKEAEGRAHHFKDFIVEQTSKIEELRDLLEDVDLPAKDTAAYRGEIRRMRKQIAVLQQPHPDDVIRESYEEIARYEWRYELFIDKKKMLSTAKDRQKFSNEAKAKRG